MEEGSFLVYVPNSISTINLGSVVCRHDVANPYFYEKTIKEMELEEKFTSNYLTFTFIFLYATYIFTSMTLINYHRNVAVTKKKLKTTIVSSNHRVSPS